MGKSPLQYNIAVHNRIAKKYEAIHGEIYNEEEQSRLRAALEKAITSIATTTPKKVALDFGCGAGNLTTHLTELGCEVVAADVSRGFLDLVGSRLYREKVTTFQLNGTDLTGIQSDSIDIVAMYSVLHHVPDYLSLMGEFARVLKPGGVIYIDHEASGTLWHAHGNHEMFKVAMKKRSKRDIGKYFMLSNYIDRAIRMFLNPKFQREGDIHVFQDDHIVWEDIHKKLQANGVEILKEEEYLLFRRNYDRQTYDEWKNKTQDMHLVIGRKK